MKLATFSRGIRSIPIVETVLQAELVKVKKSAANDESIKGYVGWGRKPSGLRAQQEADGSKKTVVFLEDGFLGFWGHPGSGAATRLSLIVDHSGIYYDARNPSDLENRLSNCGELSEGQRNRIRRVREQIIQSGLSKYNHHADTELPQWLYHRIEEASSTVLVVDQTLGDESISCGLAGQKHFTDMLSSAVAENPGALIVVKTHPDVLVGKKLSALGKLDDSGAKNIVCVAENLHPHALIKAVDKVYVVTSQLGLEALIYKKPVICFGVPFYAGWGLTDDRGQVPSRRNRTLDYEQLLYQSLITYPVYVDPGSGKVSDVETVLEWMAEKRESERTRHESLHAVGFSFWKRSWLRAFTSPYSRKLRFCRENQLASVSDSLPLLVWGMRAADRLKQKFPDRTIYTMEDGFIRSVGLGTDLKRPSSVVIDKRGIYYDARTESDLEVMINTTRLNQREREQGQHIIDSFVANGATKYNVGTPLDEGLCEWFAHQRERDRQVILVPGQVEGDASIEFGGVGIKTNLELLRAVREDFPLASIIYKPHPDIIARNRSNHLGFDEEGVLADKIVLDADISQLYLQVDRVCVLTSQSGFEALIRNVPVSCYGLPFYAGWGLTEDRYPIARREARPTLQELVYHCVVKYPLYVDWQSWRPSSASEVLRHLDGVRKVNASNSGAIRRAFRKIQYLLESLRFRNVIS